MEKYIPSSEDTNHTIIVDTFNCCFYLGATSVVGIGGIGVVIDGLNAILGRLVKGVN